MKASEIYLRAAKMIGSEKLPACMVIAHVALGDCNAFVECEEAKRFAKWFAPPEKLNPTGWLSWGNAWGETQPWVVDADVADECRVLALLFMHHIAKDSE